MVPARLTLRNFLCYRDCPPVDLEQVRLACLTGSNGNGKSALLDAITWALWDRARGRDGDLISLGQTEMEVEFEFFVGEARYRVVRKAQKVGAKGSIRTSVVFHIWDGAGWKDQSGSTQHETQRAIENVLKLSYDTFVNSAFLIQGKADMFTVKTPSERKQVLAEILNLSQYDLYEERAKERRNERARSAQHLEQQIHDAEVEVPRLPGLREDRDAAKLELDEREQEREAAAVTLTALDRGAAEAEKLREDVARAEGDRGRAVQVLAEVEAQAALRRAEIDGCLSLIAEAPSIRDGFARLGQARETLTTLQSEANRLAVEIDAAGREHETSARDLAAARERMRRQQAIIDRHAQVAAEAEAIRDGYARLQAARAAEAEYGRRLTAVIALRQRMRPLEATVARAESDLRGSLHVQEAEVERLGALAARLEPLQRERQAAAREQADLDAADKRLGALRADESDCRSEAQALTSRNKLLREEIDGLKRKFDELKVAVEHGAADCPLCRSNLGADGLRRIEESYAAEGRAKQEEFRRNRARIAEMEANAQSRDAEARRLDADLRHRRDEWQRRLALLDGGLREAEQAASAIPGVRAEVERLARDLAAGTFALDERRQITTLEQQIAAEAYDEHEHERARDELTACLPFEGRQQQLVTAESQLAPAREALAEAETDARRLQQRGESAARRMDALQSQRDGLRLDGARHEVETLAPYERRHTDLAAAERRLPGARDDLRVQEGHAETWRRQRDESAKRVAEYGRRLAALGDAVAQLPPARARVTELTDRCAEITRALGGIEEAIDELEKLERLTDERRRKLAATKREHADYDELALAFGKRGVQALIIDAALPEIEAAANDLLARMTNNRMHLALETQRQNQKGNVVETLDIKIADEWGTRSYEMFSGGEAFRINLALRIALSKLLARRAGAPLPTLVIDEGFGTQDTAGRERLIEAITAIQDEFQCLLVVTHIDELKDLFDTRIEVVKHGDGSVARVVAV